MSKITTHVLDAMLGKPAAGIALSLDKKNDRGWEPVSTSATGDDGRCSDLARDASQGVYRLTFQTGAYLARLGRTGLYAEIAITFTCDGEAHYHLPLLLSDNSYTTYRGS